MEKMSAVKLKKSGEKVGNAEGENEIENVDEETKVTVEGEKVVNNISDFTKMLTVCDALDNVF